MDEVTVALETGPTKETLTAIDEMLDAHNRRALDWDGEKLTIVARNANDAVVGGLRGETYWGWLYVEMLALREDAQRQGIGSRLLALAEAEAVRRGCRHVYLDTFSFQALPFYQKQGYTIFGQLDDFPGEHTRYFLRKDLP